MTNKIDQLASLIRAGWPGILVQSSEETRVDRMLQQVAEQLALTPTEWNLGYGWVRFDNKQALLGTGGDTRLAACLPALVDEDLDGKLVVIKSTALALDQDALAVARLRQLLVRIERHHRGRCAVVLLSERASLPPEIEPLVALLHLPLPSREEIRATLDGFCTEHSLAVGSDLRPMVVAACSGLSELELRTVLMTATDCGARLDDATVEAIIGAKEQIIAKGGVLEMVAVRNGIADIGGLDALKQWLQRRAAIVQRLGDAEAFGVKAPKGVLIAGMPGCGKSLTAKVAAGLFRLPLLRLDIGSLLGKYVGESEHNMRRALHMAETVSPCVLWVDELEKAFVGLGNGASEVSTRLLGYFLTWMQEKSAAVFVIATANDVTALPPELLRKGRFDEIFYVGFPNAEERTQILRIHLDKAGQAGQGFDLQALAAQCRDYTGADIESAINEALETAFIDGVPLTQSLLLEAIRATVPLRETLREKVGQYEELFEKLRLKSASSTTRMSVARMIRESDNPNQIKREEVAANPDCPANLLEKLARDGEYGVREKVLRNPHCPENLLSVRINIASDNPDFDDKLRELACLHPNAPVDLLIRLIENGRFPTGLRNTIFRCSPQPEELWNKFCRWADIGGNPDQTDAACAFAANHALPEEMQKSMYRSAEGPAVLRVLASNLRLCEYVQELLLNEDDKQVRLNLARNFRKTEDVQLRLVEDDDVEVRTLLAGQRLLCEKAQCSLAEDPVLEVRLALARNLYVSDFTQSILVRDKLPSVRQTIVSYDRLGPQAQMAVATGEHVDAKLALLQNSMCKLTEAVQWTFVQDPEPKLRTALLSRDTSFYADGVKLHLAMNVDLDMATAMQMYPLHRSELIPDQVLRKFLDAKGGLGQQALYAICKRSVLDRDFQLHLLASAHILLSDSLVGAAFRLEPELQAFLAGRLSVDRVRLAFRSDLLPEIQADLARDKDETVRKALSHNPALTEDTRKILAAFDMRAA